MSIRDTCLSVFCSVPAFYPAMRRWPRATLTSARAHAQSRCTCLIYVVCICTPTRVHVHLQCHVCGICHARVQATRKSECVPQIYVRRAVMHVHCMQWCKCSHLEIQLRARSTKRSTIGALSHAHSYVACNLRTCAVYRLHGAKYAVCRLHGSQSADCMVTVQTKDPSNTCDSFSKFQRNLRFSARFNFLTKLTNNLCLFDNGCYSFSCL